MIVDIQGSRETALTLAERQTALAQQHAATKALHARATQAARQAEIKMVQLEAQLALLTELQGEPPSPA